ncbi:PKD domain-containing protein [Halorussus salilacus]|uniref:PKD domain-containing protein n=1 Tax=Halorussus salilacus TaxID=2953750 RepID=UPI00209F6DA3|nr:PKD domain-containing protein [Halorussus salilacus]USZ68084.1 PKD domain-containing protein [Halorussus salilacus]
MRRALASVLLVVLVASAPAVGTVSTAPSSTPAAAQSAANTDAPEPPERWNATVGGGGDDKLTNGVKTDEGYLVVGWTDSDTSDGADDGYVAMVDESGRTTWERAFGGDGADRLFDVKRVDGGYLLAGYTADDGSERDGWVMKIDEEGERQWERTYGEDGSSAFWSLETDGDAIYAGGWQDDGNAEAWLMELDADGEEVWSETYDTLRSGSDEYVNSIFADDDGLLLTGTIESSTYDPSDAWVLKVDGEGEVRWEEEYGGTDVDRVHDAAATDDGGYVLAGRTASHGEDGEDGWLLKIDGEGDQQWDRTYGTERDDAFYGVLAEEDGYVLTGAKHKLDERGADGWVIRADESGSKQWEQTYGNDNWDKFWPAIEGHDGGYLAVGDSTSFSENQDGWLVRVGGPAAAAIEDADENATGTTVELDGSPVRTVTLADANASGVLTVSEEADLSAVSPPGEPVYAVNVSGPDSVENDSATVEFSVPTDAGEVEDLRVAQRSDEGWAVLETEMVSEGNDTAVLSAQANGSATLAVTEVEAPSADIDLDESVPVGESAALSAEGSSAQNGSLDAYEWTVGDETDDGETAEVSFEDPGEREVELTVTDAAGLTDTETATLVVNDEPAVSVEAPDSVTVGDAATFSADVDNEVGNATVTWEFGDGEVTGEEVEHSFGSTGTQTVTVVVEDEYGATATEEVEVEVASQDDAETNDSETETTDGGDTDGSDTETTDGDIPGFGVTAALVALLAAALAAARRAS